MIPIFGCANTCTLVVLSCILEYRYKNACFRAGSLVGQDLLDQQKQITVDLSRTPAEQVHTYVSKSMKEAIGKVVLASFCLNPALFPSDI